MRLYKLRDRFLSELLCEQLSAAFHPLVPHVEQRWNTYQFDDKFLKDTGAMPRGKKQQSSKAAHAAPAAGGPVRWLYYRLADADIAIVLEEASDIDGLCVGISRVISGDADFSVRRNLDRGNFSAYITLSDDREGDSARIGFSAFGGTAWQAVAGILYKLRLYEHNPSAFSGGGGSLGIG